MRKYVKVYNNMRKYGMVCKSRRKITKKEKVRTSLPNLNKLWLTVVTRMWPKFCTRSKKNNYFEIWFKFRTFLKKCLKEL